jgi:hypothetical protein
MISVPNVPATPIVPNVQSEEPAIVEPLNVRTVERLLSPLRAIRVIHGGGKTFSIEMKDADQAHRPAQRRVRR